MRSERPTKSPYTKREDAVVLLQAQFRARAATLSCGDGALADDLVSVMSASVLENKEAIATLGYYANGAVQDAQDERRKHFLRQRDDLKRLYVPGKETDRCKERAEPGKCKRETGKRHSQRGRPPSEEDGVKRRLAMRMNPKALIELRRMAKGAGITQEMLVRGALALLAQTRGDDDVARNFMRT